MPPPPKFVYEIVFKGDKTYWVVDTSRAKALEYLATKIDLDVSKLMHCDRIGQVT
jgi:hypothetical protein